MNLDSLSSLPPDILRSVLEGPALAPPPGVVPEFKNPPNQNGLAYATVTVTVVLSSTFFIIKVCSRVFCVKKVQVEDLFILAAYVLHVI
ncbi:hypothetical protein F4859DRAFT_513764 [Xylaria cf. heliscus]|nr:hypothetical protein F4859DRAFT_513764 [Xylaria cf. heliscus]